jgi:hypothetical protein
LGALQANDNVALPSDQVEIFANLTGLNPVTVKTIILRVTKSKRVHQRGWHS